MVNESRGENRYYCIAGCREIQFRFKGRVTDVDAVRISICTVRKKTHGKSSVVFLQPPF